MSTYWVRVGDETKGPFRAAELKKLAAQGKLEATALISPDRQKWVKAESVKGLNLGIVASSRKPGVADVLDAGDGALPQLGTAISHPPQQQCNASVRNPGPTRTSDNTSSCDPVVATLDLTLYLSERDRKRREHKVTKASWKSNAVQYGALSLASLLTYPILRHFDVGATASALATVIAFATLTVCGLIVVIVEEFMSSDRLERTNSGQLQLRRSARRFGKPRVTVTAFHGLARIEVETSLINPKTNWNAYDVYLVTRSGERIAKVLGGTTEHGLEYFEQKLQQVREFTQLPVEQC